MTTSFDLPSESAWQSLHALAQAAPTVASAVNDSDWQTRSTLSLGPLTVNVGHHQMSSKIFDHLLALLEASPFKTLKAGLFNGDPINLTEHRAVGHTRIRTPEFIKTDPTLAAIKSFSQRVRAGQHCGGTNERIKDVINIGIGGSDLGPKMVCQALSPTHPGPITSHFVSNVDGAEIAQTLMRCSPETTLVIIASKTFTTQETMLNAKTAMAWLEAAIPDATLRGRHLAAVTTASERAMTLGIPSEQIFSFGEDIGGRYSLWSSIGLVIALQLGFSAFKALLLGANTMDAHFAQAEPQKNIPVVLALLSIWYGNFLKVQSQAIIPYCERMNLFPAFLQQMDMESLGKRTQRDGAPANYPTGLITWGQTGTNGQHAFFQLLHQGQHLVPIDFLGFAEDPISEPEAHRVLRLHLAAQITALALGQPAPENLHRDYPGNRPSSLLMMSALTPETLGMLIALYEHKVLTCSAVWNVNAFDQWGVELGKQLAKAFEQPSQSMHDTTRTLLEHIKLLP
ncbi:MAG: glucose-6-phosphate isomerase [Pseudomonadales bacterium]